MCSIARSANFAWSAIAANLQPEVFLDPFDEPVEGDVIGAEGTLLPVLLDDDRVDRAGALGDGHRRPPVLVDEGAQLRQLRVVPPSGHQAGCGFRAGRRRPGCTVVSPVRAPGLRRMAWKARRSTTCMGSNGLVR